MKKIFLLTTIGALALTSCTHDFGDYDGSINKPTKEEINKNIAEIFGSIDPNQDWNVHSSGTVSITANAPLHDIVEVQILTGSPFFNSECSIVNSAKVQKGETVSLTYEVPYDYESLVAACVDSKGHYYVKSFNIGTTSVNFKSNSTRAMTRGLNDYNDIDLSKIALGFQTSTLSYNAARTRYANLAASGNYGDLKDYIEKNNLGVWKNANWENDRMWKISNTSTGSSTWSISGGALKRTINNIDENEKSQLNAILSTNFSRVKEGNKKKDNLKLIRNSDVVSLYNNHLTSDGVNPITIIPIQTASTESEYCDIYYYYYNPSEIPNGMTEDDYIKQLPKIKAVILSDIMKSAGVSQGNTSLFKCNEIMLPFYGKPSEFMPTKVQSSSFASTDGKIYRISNGDETTANGKYYMTYKADASYQMATLYEDNDVNDVRNQLWQIFTFNSDQSKTMLYNIGSQSFLIWDNNNNTSFSNDFSDSESDEKYLYYTWDNKKHLHVGGPKGKVIKFNHQATFDRITIDNDNTNASRIWNLEEYDSNDVKIKAVENVEINMFPSSVKAVSNIIPKDYRIGFALQKHRSGKGDDALNRNILAHKTNGCVYGNGKMNREINQFGDFASAVKLYSMQIDDPRVAMFEANGKIFITFEDGTDATFGDIVLEVGGFDKEVLSETPENTENKSTGFDHSVLYTQVELEKSAFLMCFEDSPKADYDMNDVVLKIERISETQVEVSIIACGAHDELYLMGLNEETFNNNAEIHSLFGFNDTRPFINTTDDDALEPISKIFSIGEGIPMSKWVEQIYIYDKTQDNEIRLSNAGEDPHAIIIPGDVPYPKEKTCINDAYPQFVDWVQNAEENKYWFRHAMDELVYKKK